MLDSSSELSKDTKKEVVSENTTADSVTPEDTKSSENISAKNRDSNDSQNISTK